ncbi:MAG: sigma-70 family RNA polymerase sigma factor [Ruminococcus sp.]|nr:sigma-70 family RNA polymerase sigma factor [Ruminococcus sp.]
MVTIANDEQNIISMLNQRDEQALHETEQKYGAVCRRIANNILGDERDTEECVNDAFLKIWNSIPPASPDDYAAYLLKIVRNNALNMLKQRTRAKRGAGQLPASLDELSEILPSSKNVEGEVEKRELLAAVTQFLRGLSPKHRDLFIGRYWRFSDDETLAQKFGMTEHHVQVTLSRLRKKLRQYLEKEGFL